MLTEIQTYVVCWTWTGWDWPAQLNEDIQVWWVFLKLTHISMWNVVSMTTLLTAFETFITFSYGFNLTQSSTGRAFVAESRIHAYLLSFAVTETRLTGSYAKCLQSFVQIFENSLLSNLWMCPLSELLIEVSCYCKTHITACSNTS